MKFSNSPLVGIGFALLAFALFSGHDVIVKLLGAKYSVFQVMFFAGLFSYIPITLAMMTDRAVDNFIPKKPVWIVARSIANVVAVSAAFYAFSTLPLAEVYALIFATPLLITLLAVPMLGETIRLRRGVAVVVGLVGVVIVLRPTTIDFSIGHAAALLAAVAGAFGAIIVRKLGRSERTAVIILYPLFTSLIAMAALQPFVFTAVDFTGMSLMALVGLLAVGAQFLIIAAYRAAPAAVVAPMQYSQMLWAVIYGYLIFNEVPDAEVFIGFAIIVASGLYIVMREARTEASDTSPLLRNPNVRPDTGPTPTPKIHRQVSPEGNVVPDEEA